MKKIVIYIAIITAMMMAGCSSSTNNVKGDLHIYTVDNTDGKITPKMIEDAFTQAGFTIGINSDIHGGLTKRDIKSGFKVYNAISIYHPNISINLVKKYADAGVFLPMGLAVFQKENETDLHISVVSAAKQTKMLGSGGVLLKSLEAEIDKVITTLIPNVKHTYNDASLKDDRVQITKYELDIGDADWEEAKENLEENFEDQFDAAGFVMPSYFDLSDEFGDDSPYDFYATYSICKIDVIVSVSKVRPEAAAFAPCTTMMYKKKGEAKIVMGFTAVYNWMSSAVITDKDSINALNKAQTDFEAILGDVTK